jgi:hypothetical protein
MNTHLIRAHGTVMDRWAVWIVFALYLVAFGIFATTTVPGMPVV